MISVRGNVASIGGRRATYYQRHCSISYNRPSGCIETLLSIFGTQGESYHPRSANSVHLHRSYSDVFAEYSRTCIASMIACELAATSTGWSVGMPGVIAEAFILCQRFVDFPQDQVQSLGSNSVSVGPRTWFPPFLYGRLEPIELCVRCNC